MLHILQKLAGRRSICAEIPGLANRGLQPNHTDVRFRADTKFGSTTDLRRKAADNLAATASTQWADSLLAAFGVATKFVDFLFKVVN